MDFKKKNLDIVFFLINSRVLMFFFKPKYTISIFLFIYFENIKIIPFQ